MLRALARLAARLSGWRLVGDPPQCEKYVLLGYPHTSNWDFVIMLMFGLASGANFSWVGKHTLFRRPFGGLMRRLGGIPVDRRRSQGAVEQLVEEFGRRRRLILVVSPEGTRRRVEHWKSGFYHIALGAGVPLGLGFLDYPSRTAGFATLIDLTGDHTADMDRIRAFYADKHGKLPGSTGAIRLRDEDDPAR